MANWSVCFRLRAITVFLFLRDFESFFLNAPIAFPFFGGPEDAENDATRWCRLLSFQHPSHEQMSRGQLSRVFSKKTKIKRGRGELSPFLLRFSVSDDAHQPSVSTVSVNIRRASHGDCRERKAANHAPGMRRSRLASGLGNLLVMPTCPINLLAMNCDFWIRRQQQVSIRKECPHHLVRTSINIQFSALEDHMIWREHSTTIDSA